MTVIGLNVTDITFQLSVSLRRHPILGAIVKITYRIQGDSKCYAQT